MLPETTEEAIAVITETVSVAAVVPRAEAIELREKEDVDNVNAEES